MRKLKMLAAIVLAVPFLVSSPTSRAGSADQAASARPKPDLLTTCPVSGDKLGEMAPPYVFTYKGQEVKLCCSGCKKDFDKDPAKYLEKIRAADKDAKN